VVALGLWQDVVKGRDRRLTYVDEDDLDADWRRRLGQPSASATGGHKNWSDVAEPLLSVGGQADAGTLVTPNRYSLRAAELLVAGNLMVVLQRSNPVPATNDIMRRASVPSDRGSCAFWSSAERQH